MRAKIIVLFVLLSIASPVAATPTPPVLAVNHTTRQCAEIIQGDDCHWCDLAEGWEILGYRGEATCPAGYEDLGFQGMTGDCRGYKNQFCCADGSHHGDCEDLVINESQRQCAFVEEISDCTLPEGWVSAADATPWSGRCPSGYQWVPDMACVTVLETATPTTAPRAEPAAGAMIVATQEPSSGQRVRPGIAWGVAIVLGLSLALGWLILQRRQPR